MVRKYFRGNNPAAVERISVPFPHIMDDDEMESFAESNPHLSEVLQMHEDEHPGGALRGAAFAFLAMTAVTLLVYGVYRLWRQ